MKKIVPIQPTKTRNKLLGLLPAKAIVIFAVTAFSAVGLTILDLFSMRYFVKELVANSGMERLFLIFMFYILLAIALNLIKIWGKIISYPFFTAIRNEQMARVSNQILTMDLKYYENPVFMTSVMAAVKCLQSSDSGLEGYYRKFLDFTGECVSVFVLILLMGGLSPWLIPLFLGTLFLQSIIDNRKSKIEDLTRSELRGAQRKFSSYTGSASNHTYAKDNLLFQYQQKLKEASDTVHQDLNGIWRKKSKHNIFYEILSVLMLAIPDAIVLWMVFTNKQNGMSLEDVVFYITGLGLITYRVNTITAQLSFLNRSLREVAVQFSFLDAGLTEERGYPFVSLQRASSIEFEHVSFQYPAGKTKVFENLSLNIHPGEKIAIVGINGAGKTTLIKLLTGLYRPDSGRILIGGIDASDIPREQMKELIAVVFQQIEAVSGTIAQNIAASLESVDRELVDKVLDMAGIRDRITKTKDGMDSMLLKVEDPNGIVLSGGELQKLMMARALYKRDSGILILDEPTASLDAIAEEELYQNFSNLMQEKTSIFISHRLASTQFCDRIFVLDAGVIVENGTHEELLDQNGFYRRLFDKQKESYCENENDGKGDSVREKQQK